MNRSPAQEVPSDVKDHSNSMWNCPSWRANSRLTDQQIPFLLGTRMSIAPFIKGLYLVCILYWINPATPSYFNDEKSILILYSRLRKVSEVVCPLQAFEVNFSSVRFSATFSVCPSRLCLFWVSYLIRTDPWLLMKITCPYVSSLTITVI